MLKAIEIGFITLIGLSVGSFANVVIYRLPKGISLLSPPSACPSCKHHIGIVENIPIVSWIVLKGRCRSCKKPISPRYVVVETLVAVSFLLLFYRFGLSYLFFIFCLFFLVLIIISAIDLEHKIVPNKIIYPTIFVTIPIFIVIAFSDKTTVNFENAILGGVGSFLFFLIIHLIQPKGMGFGDVRLAGVVGLYMGWLGLGQAFISICLSFFIGSFFGLLLIGLGRSRKTKVPFAPFLASGAILCVFFGQSFLNFWLGSSAHL